MYKLHFFNHIKIDADTKYVYLISYQKYFWGNGQTHSYSTTKLFIALFPMSRLLSSLMIVQKMYTWYYMILVLQYKYNNAIYIVLLCLHRLVCTEIAHIKHCVWSHNFKLINFATEHFFSFVRHKLTWSFNLFTQS